MEAAWLKETVKQRGTQALSRRELWTTKRVFFLTPQIMVNDLSRGTCLAVEIKCLVIDEAHKALGNHAYCQVVRELSKYTNQFRILALSATPGSDTKAVQQVISNLLIAQIELCAEDSPEIQPYSHERHVEKIVVPLGEELVEIQNAYIQVLETFAGRLIKIGVLARRDIPSLTKYQIILARDQYRKNPSSQNVGIHQGIIEGDFALCISLYHGYELLLQMGVRSLFIYLFGIMDGSKGLTRTKNELGRNEDFMKLYQQLRDMFSDTSLASANGNIYKIFENKKEFIYSHPKLRKLEEIVIEHFKSWKKGFTMERTSVDAVDTRVMIFSSFRDSVQEIAEMLSRLSPVVRVMTFVGHSTGKSTKGFTQKEQLEVVKRFREGGYNTLVSTCVGEEGLDIGEVDLIICFDAQKSPIRLVQRMGRTGRRRQGRIVVILAEGREERTYNQSQSNKRSIHKAISGNKTLHFYQHSPRMIPEGITPKLHKMFITAEKYEPSNSRMLSKERRSSSLQHKSALFSCVTGQRQIPCHENWSLSPEEFEIWERLYRIKESDGVKEPILPQIQFETLENLEEKREEEATHELSLSEWRIWQNRPFPTSMVDHSDRCYHFISVMEMIELMRHEQGDCSYELEIQPHLRIEDVNVQRNKSHFSITNSAVDQKACSSRKDMVHRSKVKPFLLNTNDNGNEFFTTFKITKTKGPKRTSELNLEVPGLPTDSSASASSPARRLAVVEDTDQSSQKDEELKVTFDLNEFIDLCDNSESTIIHESAAIKEYKTVDKACRSLGTNHTDLGYSSFTVEKSPVSSDLFYLPESYVDSLALVGPSEEPSWLKQILSNVKRLLSQSPPSLNELYDFENRMRNEETTRPFQNVISGYSERLQDKGVPVSSEADRSLLLFDNAELKVANELCASVRTCLTKSISSSETAAVNAKGELHCDDSFDSLFDNEEFTEIQIKTTTINHTLTNNPSKNNKRSVRSDPGESVVRPVAAQGSAGFPSEVFCINADKACKEQPMSSKTPAREVSGDIRVTEQSLDDDDLYDCSQELFSVHFDLGFSIEEYENEISEENINTNNTGKLNSASESHADVKSTENNKQTLNDRSRLETSPKWNYRNLERRDISTPLPFQSRSVNAGEGTEGATTAGPSLKSGDRRTGSGSPEALASALSTPTSRKVRNIVAVKRIPMNVFSSAGEEVLEVPLTDQVNKIPHRQNCGSSAMDALDSPLGRTENLEDANLRSSHVSPADGTSSESEEEIVFQRKNWKKKNVLKSPDVMNDSDFESPIRAVRKRRHPLSMSDMSSDDSMDFHKNSSRTTSSSSAAHKKQLRSTKRQKVKNNFTYKNAARQFLDEEAELSQQDADGVSSDESDAENELNSSLAQFLNDDVEVTQVLNDCEMKGVYLKSVRSPALGNRYKMVHRDFNSMAIFSQIPEQDQTYAEDSFCVREEEEETCRKSESSEEEVCVNFDLLNDESFTSGKKQYLTRRRKKLNQARMEDNYSIPMQKRKPSRIIVLSDSSEEETSVSHEKPMKTECSRAEQENTKLPKSLPAVSSAQHKNIAGETSVPQSVESKGEMLLGLKASVSETLDFHPAHRVRSTRFPPHLTSSDSGKEHLQAPTEVESSLKNTCRSPSVPPRSASTNPSSATALFSRDPVEKRPPLCVLVDSREISSGAEVISSLKAVHGVKVQVCSLSSSDYIVSNRMAVERRFLSELLNSGNRSKVTQRIQRLQSMFERICVIVEKDRTKTGETTRFFQRTQYYDGVLSALVQAGVRILFSSCQEETAGLLKDLALVEQRKDAAIRVPTEVEGHKREMLNFYLSIPNLSYLAALNMCHHFHSVRKMANSSPLDIATGAQVSLQKAEEIYRYLHYGFDAQMLPKDLCAKGRSNTAAKS
ncbi:PREDICTED: Fanconi anemia group M protein [Charadrius vociferus]|uniref:Fanconi anemia group M protein n=1 Tax=Charadrius vociferus TaxID=50402 RepID=UPI000521811D|nr:PREDICTED: Fanconi anemia group M protein [Charadrius vociferus]